MVVDSFADIAAVVVAVDYTCSLELLASAVDCMYSFVAAVDKTVAAAAGGVAEYCKHLELVAEYYSLLEAHCNLVDSVYKPPLVVGLASDNFDSETAGTVLHGYQFPVANNYPL